VKSDSLLRLTFSRLLGRVVTFDKHPPRRDIFQVAHRTVPVFDGYQGTYMAIAARPSYQ
jgi:hypothetical protein